MNVPPIAELRNLSDETLIERHDYLVNKSNNVSDSVRYYLDELARRETDRTNQRMAKLTQDIHRMTIAITVMTLISLVTSIVNMFR